MNAIKILGTGACSVLSFLFVAACATAPPPELVDARGAYARAQNGAASRLVPARLVTARTSLDAAEESFDEDGDTSRTRALAYVAQRRAQLAEAHASVAMSARRTARAEEALLASQAAQQVRTTAELAQTRSLLAVRQEQVASGREELATERAAREAADARTNAALASLRQVASVQDEERGIVITLSGSVLFASGMAELLPISLQRLDQVAATLRDYPDQDMVVEGHTDSRGSASMNADLSLRRAQAVVSYLTAHGVPTARIRAQGIGPDRPVANNGSAEGRANNRRVEIILNRVPASATATPNPLLPGQA